MFSKITTRVALLAAGIVGLAGLSGTARADVLFTNLTSQTLNFSISCAGSGGADAWRVNPHSTGALTCRNGADSAQVTIRTQHSNGTEVVRSTVFDGRSYDLGYDADGDVSIARRS
jgi:hypothetical protein